MKLCNPQDWYNFKNEHLKVGKIFKMVSFCGQSTTGGRLGENRKIINISTSFIFFECGSKLSIPRAKDIASVTEDSFEVYRFGYEGGGEFGTMVYKLID